MKTTQILFIGMIIFTIQLANAQKTNTTKTEKHHTQKENLLDMQTNVLSSLLGENLDGKPNGSTINFLELLEKTDLPANQKLEYKNMYYLQARELTQKQKDSLGKAIEKKILEAQRDH
ncbi:hypothetical protein [Aquimarina algicola]|uniref:DUF4296 domain-containing protein n=1 Tax=Aquimarina algicola TaxID=2589995 RepID=A0A504J3C1_9FLAO|nr:hypothetical protein [Aquimarina algicola]TPN85377.1 hypothetical protein FHK87_15285 [Aquimarina algicola]